PNTFLKKMISRKAIKGEERKNMSLGMTTIPISDKDDNETTPIVLGTLSRKMTFSARPIRNMKYGIGASHTASWAAGEPGSWISGPESSSSQSGMSIIRCEAAQEYRTQLVKPAYSSLNR